MSPAMVPINKTSLRKPDLPVQLTVDLMSIALSTATSRRDMSLESVADVLGFLQGTLWATLVTLKSGSEMCCVFSAQISCKFSLL